MHELLALSLLMHWPLHAYRLTKIANNIIGPEEAISRGTLSALLAKLEQAGLITSADPATVPFPSERSSQVWALTPQGCERFVQLMLDTTSSQGACSKAFHQGPAPGILICRAAVSPRGPLSGILPAAPSSEAGKLPGA